MAAPPNGSPSPSPTLPDAWDAGGGIPLDGLLERNKVSPLLLALLPVVAFVIFFVISNLASVGLLLWEGIDFAGGALEFEALIQEHARSLILANTAGQVLGLALPALLLAWLHSSRWGAFLRFRAPDARLLALAILAWMALLPVVSWVGELNQLLPLPEAVEVWDAQQMALVEQVLLGDLTIAFSLAMLAVTPAFCEEILFRGYAQRQAERGMGVAAGILFSGVVFGFFHLRLTQVLPLTLLGIFLAYLAWRTGSLWIPIVIHFLNNGYAVVLGFWARGQEAVSLTAIEQVPIPWYVVVAGAVFFGIVTVAMEHRARRLVSTAAVTTNNAPLADNPKRP